MLQFSRRAKKFNRPAPYLSSNVILLNSIE